MTLVFILLGAALLAYPIYAAVGLGLALCVFGGILCIMYAFYTWFIQSRNNAVILHNAQRVLLDQLAREAHK